MTIPKEIIEAAIEGGWCPKWPHNGEEVRAFGLKQVNDNSITIEISMRHRMVVPFPEIICDPTFWQALSKQFGWGKNPVNEDRTCKHCGTDIDIQPPFKSGCNHAHYPEACGVCMDGTKDWKAKAMEYFDLLLTNKITDEYWKELK